MTACVSAASTFVTPAIIFPRVHYKEHMINNAPPGIIGMATSSGWFNAELFVKYFEHLISIVKPSPGHEVLLVMDNHESHLSLEAINLAKENGIIILTFPLHTNHKLQPLDRTVFGSFKSYYKKTCKDWMLSHPRKPISIYDVAQLGYWHLVIQVFGNHEFLPVEMTNRPLGQNIGDESGSETPSTSVALKREVSVTPEHIRPFPKAPPRKSSGRGGKPRRCLIVTDIPEKQRIGEEKKDEPSEDNSSSEGATEGVTATFDLFDSSSGPDLTLSPQTFTNSAEAFINDNSNSLGVPAENDAERGFLGFVPNYEIDLVFT
ncbi:hypothetical protein ILUMI_07374 [Ignelater luminosus]|uniref:DDE-1 domain-containing protein n=1 Tax=Ignelater luminosus TaxID=2038154 RepID=A0A8K0GBN9_IGNLU|nr:hypothetical protein ILUMI_07374 [Ignelater luminosus]